MKRSFLCWQIRALPLTLLMVFWHHTASAEITLYRDRFGVPSIAADRLPDAIYGLGYAMASDNAEQMARNYKQARGRIAEIDGRSALLTDGFLRALGIEEMAEKQSRSMKGEMSVLIHRFCDGANRALAEQKRKLPEWVEPFTPTDVLALAQMTNASMALLEVAKQLLPGAGSNQFAVTPKRTATGHALLSIDPHLDWNGLLAWYEFTLYTKDYDFRGVTLSGLPFGVMGHTSRVAWSMTNNNPDLYDFYTVQTNPDNPKQYNYHGDWRDYEDVQVELRYRENGELKTQKQRVRRTAWGPMVPLRPQALRLSMIGEWEVLDEALRMARAKDAAQFREALRPQGIAMWNIVYADTKGTIGYQYNARVARRDTTFDWTKPVPGSDPRTKWGLLWTQDELPHIQNPASNLLVNANSAPWLTPLGSEIKPYAWPAYVTSYETTTRYDRLSALLQQEQHLTVERAKQIATDTQVPYAAEAIRALLASVAQSSSVGELKDAQAVLSRWNGRSEPNAVGCGLYYYWLRADKAMAKLAQKAKQGAWEQSEKSAAVEALQKATTAMMDDHKSLSVPWGEIHLSRRGKVTAPLGGFGGIAFDTNGRDMASVVPNWGTFRNGVLTCTGGSSVRMIVDLDPKGIRSWSILPYGNVQDSNDPHATDQMALFGRGEYKDTLFGLANIRRNAVSRRVLEAVSSTK